MVLLNLVSLSSLAHGSIILLHTSALTAEITEVAHYVYQDRKENKAAFVPGVWTAALLQMDGDGAMSPPLPSSPLSS